MLARVQMTDNLDEESAPATAVAVQRRSVKRRRGGVGPVAAAAAE